MFGNQIYKLKMTQNTSSNSSILEIMDSKEFHNKNNKLHKPDQEINEVCFRYFVVN